jgi:hypothetical protein
MKVHTMNKPLTCIAITASLLAGPTGAVWARGPADTTPPAKAACPCNGAAEPAQAAKRAVPSQGTGSNRAFPATATPVRQVTPAASGAGGTTQ